MSFSYVCDQGKDLTTPFQKCTADDYPIFSYTSGTTGDSKGVKITHRNYIISCGPIVPLFPLTKEDSYISYLPYPHTFEQCMSFLSVMRGFKIGYYQGDALKLIEDC